VGITLDVTERKGAEEKIHRLNQTLTKQLTELQDKVEQLEGFEQSGGRAEVEDDRA
jgi:hypothetical protein